MNDVLSVPTAFGDISELAEGLIDRVDDQRLILYGAFPYEEGDAVDFEVLLADGTPALAGRARVAASFDGGEERAAEARYDIVLDSLELDARSSVVHERTTVFGLSPTAAVLIAAGLLLVVVLAIVAMTRSSGGDYIDNRRL